ncbi:hypothetical protein DFR72_11741 [Lentzea flaviverrucosa]|uniref:Uncharacterized protein n=1 Tax=Lentzea flaviverrucosa TaxID=200379 RepID=A0A1H9XTB9_9PSEU|nr:hypothetical protein DFR72_11741 [Lentzea flaviverrucosa]SES49418.1 hypothetical protein SAMN05216195_117177 [Lentzea flaviverrucosa]
MFDLFARVLLAVAGTRLGYGVVMTLLVAFCGAAVLAITGRKAVRCKCCGGGGDVLSPPHTRPIASTVPSRGNRRLVKASCNVPRAHPVRRASSR